MGKESYLLELSRYVVSNPVRAGMVKHPGDYAWSIYGAMVGDTPTPVWLASDGLLLHFGSRRTEARRRYTRFVEECIGNSSIWAGLRQQIFLGNDKFIRRMQRKVMPAGDELSIPKVQRRAPAPSLDAFCAKHRERNDANIAAYAIGYYSYKEIAEFYDIHLATVGRVDRHGMLQGET